MSIYSYHQSFHELWSTSGDRYLQKTIIPIPQSPYIESCFVIENPLNISASFVILPDLAPHIIFHRLQNGEFRLRIVGPRTKAIFISRKSRRKTWVIRLKSHIWSMMLPLAASEMIDRSTSLTTLLEPKEEECLLKALFLENDEELVLRIISMLPFANICAQSSFIRAFDNCSYQDNALINVRTAAKQLGISERYLHKLSIKHLGMSPKMALKIRRFTKSLQLNAANSMFNWAQIALDAGYYDQSHMIDDYQQFVGKSPGSLFS